MEYIRQWKVGEKVFDSKADAQRYDAECRLGHYLTPELLMTNADEVIALLKPFATPRVRKPRATNGTVKGKAKAQATAHA